MTRVTLPSAGHRTERGRQGPVNTARWECRTMNDIAALFRQLTQGAYVVGVAHGEQRNAFTAAWVMQTSFNPLLLALSIAPTSASFPLLRASGGFALSVLKQGQ